MIIVENVLLDDEGIRQNEHASSSSLSSTASFVDPIPSSSNREADLKHIFVSEKPTHGPLDRCIVRYIPMAHSFTLTHSLAHSNPLVAPTVHNPSKMTHPHPNLVTHHKSHLHELYVRYTLNPFSKLRGPIQSRGFDRGILEMARSFNEKAVMTVGDGNEGRMEASLEESLSWM